MTDDDFRALFEQHKNAVYQFAWRMTNSPQAAEDIAQDVFLSLWRDEAKLDPVRGSWRTLLLGMARNVAYKRWRRDQNWAPLDDDAPAMAPVPIEGFDVQSAVSQAVQALPPLQREALVLATYSELSLQEIKEATGAEIGTVKARLHRARENLKRMLAAYKPGQERKERKWNRSKIVNSTSC